MKIVDLGPICKVIEGLQSRRSGSRSRSPMRRRSRSGSKSGDRHGHSRRSRSRSPRRDTGPPEVEENEDWISATNVLFDKYNCDLNLRIDGYKVCPITVEGFAFMWAGGRANYGVTKGKVAYQVKLLEQLNVDHLPPEETNRHVVRVGWSTDATSTQLGEEPFSYGYGGTGKASVDCKFTDYGERFTEGDVITAYVDFDVEPITISFAKNDKDLGKCFDIEKESLGEAALFPHILTKNTEFEINFGQMEEPPFPLKEGYVFINDVPEADRLRGSLPPAKKEDCEMIMMCGLPGAGKTYWAGKHAKGHPETKYNVLGTNNIIDKMKVMGLPRKRNYAGRWDVLIDKSTKCLNRLLEIAAKKKRNYILDQTNVYPSAQRRKMRPFEGFQRKAVVIVPSDEEFKKRCSQREKEEGKEVPDSAVLEMKANFQLPEVGPLFDSVEFIELGQEEAAKLVEEYNKEGRAALPPPEKRFRDRRESYGSGDRYGNRDYRGRDYRGPNRYDRDRGGRGGYGGYRDRDRGRGGYGGRGGYDRRSGGYMGYSQSDRERAKDYNSRSSYGSRRDDRNWNQGSSHHGSGWHNQKSWGNQGWGNQGSNWGQSGWGQQGSWGNQSSGWGQQGNWGNQWTGYNQGTGTQGGWNYNWNQGQWNYQQPSQNYSSWSGYGSNYQGHSK